MSEREKFLAERRTCIGGSDAADLIGLPPFGCERKLWYDKKGVPENFPFNETFHVRRGSAIEPIAVAEFASEFKVKVEAPVPHMVLAGVPYIGVHLDGIIDACDDRDSNGVLEMKIPSSRHFQKIKMSKQAPASWMTQAQWGMMVSGFQWAMIGIFNPDQFSLIRFEVAADYEQHQAFRDLAEVFWSTLEEDESPYPRLPDGDSRCWDCQWRTTCKGIGRTPASVTEQEKVDIAQRHFVTDESPSLLVLVDQYLETKAEKNDLEKFEKELKDELLGELMGRNVMLADGRRVFLHETLVNLKAKEASIQKRVSLKVL